MRLTTRHTAALAAFFIPITAAQLPAQPQERMVDGIAAVVNTNVITYGQVRELLMFRQRSMDQQPNDEMKQKMKETQDAAIQDLVDRQLIIDEFKSQGFQIPEHIVDDRINTIIREDFGGDRTAFVRTLKAQGFSLTRFREVEREKIIVQAMRQKAVQSEAVLSPDKIEGYYRQNLDKYSTPEEIRLSMIVLRPESADGSPDSVRSAASEIRQKLADGADFAGMAQMYSQDSTAELGGDWGWIDRKTLTPELNRVAFSLKPGELSDVVRVGNAFYILRVEARKAAVTKPLAEMRDEIGQKLKEQERLRLQQQWIDSLRRKAYVKIF